ncbi:uncharacterized protein LOC126904832 [Daktulosphaira vitifoliae]|uniref:uncharacterized protein LOC126904832 n=1 Tax=Daktulosphaira vitifoliae TaxID=58002 RepID=UPI0021A9FCA0|nr:uncharacterized protein LOC126904832 [Daktulosphaira vitifoliae]
MLANVLSVLYLAVFVLAVENNDDNLLPNERESKAWNILDGTKRNCMGLNGRSGVCTTQEKCTEINGKTVGRCFPFDTCCSAPLNSCGGYSGSSTIYFQNPETFQQSCTYKVNIKKNVCQLRIDFERFSLSQPTTSNNSTAYQCDTDQFTLISSDNTKLNIPILCGENSGQHVYVPLESKTILDSSTINNINIYNRVKSQITLKFQLTARDEDSTDSEPTWKLKISQIECQPNSMNWWKIKDMARQVWDWEDEDDKDITTPKYALAPEGCLQYFTEKTGTIESFNYNKGLGHYTGGLNYAICFKRASDTCGIRLKPVKFQLAYNSKQYNSVDRDCDTAVTTQDVTTESITTDAAQIMRRLRRAVTVSDDGVHNDYLLIPDGKTSTGIYGSKFCDSGLNGSGVIAKAHGPIAISFVSDDIIDPDEDVEKGFKINYSLMNTGC